MNKKKERKFSLMPRSLRKQLAVASLLLLAFVLLSVGLLQYWLMKDFVYRNKAETLYAQLMSLPPDPAFLNRNLERTNNNTIQPPGNSPFIPLLYQPDLTVMYIPLQGEAITLSQHEQTAPLLLEKQRYLSLIQELQTKKPAYFTIEKDEANRSQLLVFRISGPPHAPQGVLQIGFAADQLDKLLLTQLIVYTSLALVALICAAILYAITLHRALAPLSRIVTAAEQTDAGNLTLRLPIKQGQHEIDTLSEAFNAMLQRLDQSFATERQMTETMRQFIADASHELRTPLTSIQGFVDVLLRGAASSPEQLNRSLLSMKQESARLNRLVEELLTLAKLDQSPTIKRSMVSIGELLHALLPQLQLLANKRTVSLFIHNEAVVYADADALRQVVLNIFHNAVQHTDEENGNISLALDAEDAKAMIRIRDNGSGIAGEHLPHLFERFYRSEASRHHAKGGFGLGLAISKSIIEAHNGTIAAISPPEPAHIDEANIQIGSEFIISLPLAEA